MNAFEFVKKSGLDSTKHILRDDASLVLDVDYDDLKRIVESHKIVTDFGGVVEAKQAYADMVGCTSWSRLGTAINDFEKSSLHPLVAGFVKEGLACYVWQMTPENLEELRVHDPVKYSLACQELSC